MILAIFLNLMAGFVVVAGLYAPVVGWEMLRKRAQVRRTPVRPVSGLDSGPAAVQGQAKPYCEMTTPFSGVPCVYCEASVERLTGAGQGRYSIPIWEAHAEWKTIDPFFINDGTGDVLVSTAEDDAQLDLAQRFDLPTASERTGAITTVTPPHILESLQRQAVPFIDENNQMLPLRYIERYIAEGEPVYALGHYTNESEAIGRAFGEARSEEARVHRWILTRPSESGEVYIRPGSNTAAHFSLLWRAMCCIIFGPMVSLGVGAFLYYVWFMA